MVMPVCLDSPGKQGGGKQKAKKNLQVQTSDNHLKRYRKESCRIMAKQEAPFIFCLKKIKHVGFFVIYKLTGR